MKANAFRIVYCVIIATLLGGVYMTAQPPKAASQPEKPSSKAVVDTALQSKLAAWAKEHDGTYTIAVQELNGQERVARVQAFKAMPVASTYKLYVAYGILHDIEQGKYSLQDTLDSGDSVQTCLRKMITISDNTCGRALGFKTGWKHTEDLIKAKGMTRTYLNNYDETDQLLETEKTSTAQDHLKFLALLQRGELLDKTHTDLLVGYMKKQQWRERIPAGVPKGIVVADKPGFLPGMQNDAAIVYGPKSTYTISILASTDEPQDLADISALVYIYLQG